MIVLALDPGPTHTGFVRYDDARRVVLAHGKPTNREALALVYDATRFSNGGTDEIVCEMIASYGMAVGASVFETCVWIGRFTEANGGEMQRVYRRDVKLHLCGSVRAKDANVRAALIDKLGPPGTKKRQGPTYGIAGDAWAALGVAVTYCETKAHLGGKRAA